MRNIGRREFVKGILFSSFLFNPNYLVGEDIPKQRIFVNLPSYSLSLTNLLDNNFSDIYNFEVGIGKGERGRRQTPIGEGFVYEKREKVVFRYGENYPLLNLKKGDIIKWTNTFDKNGKPIGYNMPYSNMRGLGMKINSYYTDFVIHSTTDEFTIGTPTSDGCIRISIDNMLKLYSLVAPNIHDGKLNEIVSVNLTYNLIDFRDNILEIHANVYNLNFDYAERIRGTLRAFNFDENSFDYKKFQELIIEDNKEFEKIHKQILDILSNSYPKNFISQDLKQKLHKKYSLEEFLM